MVHAHTRVMKVAAAKRVNVNARMNASSLINYLLKFLSDWDLGRLCVPGLSSPFNSLPLVPIFAFQQNEEHMYLYLSNFFFD